MTAPTDRIRLAGLRGEVIREISNALVETLLDPDSDLGPAALLAYEKTLGAAEALIVAASSSNPGFEERDLGPEQRAEYRKAVHALNTIKRLRVE